MKWSFASAGLIIIGLFGIMIILLFHEITVSNEQDYFTLKEAAEASMIEAVDTTYYRLTGKIKISEEKFVENFTKRFVKSATFGQGNYYIEFYQIIEYPAKVSLRIVDATNSYNIFTTFDERLGTTQTNIVNELSAILDGYETEQYEENLGIFEIKNGVIQNPPIKIPEGAKMPKAICPQYEHSKLQVDILNEICIFTIEGKTKTTKATIKCPDDYPNLDKGWCKKNK